MLKSRKELRKAEDVKLVRLQPGEAEKREVLLDDVWVIDEEVGENEVDEDAGNEEATGDEDGDEDGADQGSDSESSEEEIVDDEDEEEVPELLPPPKRKRTVSFAVVPGKGKRQRRFGKNVTQ